MLGLIGALTLSRVWVRAGLRCQCKISGRYRVLSTAYVECFRAGFNKQHVTCCSNDIHSFIPKSCTARRAIGYVVYIIPKISPGKLKSSVATAAACDC